jgi:hypothetical protein
MTSTRKKVVAALAVVGVVVIISVRYVWQSIPLVHFQAVRMDAHQHLQTSSESLTREQSDRVEGVLRQYGELYRRTSDGSILITLRLSRDTDLVWNYTSKSGL